MQFDKSTPRKEITIKGVLLKVISPYTAGHTLTEEEANVLNQTLAENLRNNFAPRIKKAIEDVGGDENAVDTKSLQGELNDYTAEYEFGVRRGGSVAVDPVTKGAIALARDAVKKALKAKGKDLKDFSADQIRELAERAVEANPKFRELAAHQLELKKAAAQETLSDLAA